MVAYSPDMSTEQRQELLETIDVVERLKLVSSFLARQVEILELKGRIQNEVKSEMDKTQREYILREQLKAIQRELGEDDPQQAEINELRDKVEAAGMPEEIKTRAIKEIDRMSRIPSASPEVGVIRTYVDWLVGLPWNVSSDDLLDIKEAAKILDEDHYGLEKIKERILEYLAVRTLADTIRSPILAFVGPPGVGKTSLGKSIARAMGRKFVRMSLGGIHDEAEIRGHRRTYIGALPGRIIQNIKTAGTNNPVFMLDEVDKIGMDFRGDPSSALLEVLDPEQNNTFQDNYLEVPFDLSKVLFIATGNLLDPIPAPLRDRMEIIQLPGYTQNEKIGIARRFLIPKQMTNHGLKPKHVEITDDALLEVVQAYTHEAGVRNIEREIANIMRKVARAVAEGRKRKTIVDIKKLDEYLGPPRFEYGELEPEDQVGSATGLVVTEVGGDVVAIEVMLMEGKEDFILTGQLGEVMRESARAALSWIRSHAAALGIEREVFEKNTLHIHVPAGATPKDGPSAGITMATAMVSAFTGIPVRKDVAMTGEITLRGRVLPIGGLKQKILAAHLSGAKIVIIPRKNEKDLRDIPDEIRKQIKIIPVDSSEQALDAALRRKPVPLAPKPPVATKPEPTAKDEPDERERPRPAARLPTGGPAAGDRHAGRRPGVARHGRTSRPGLSRARCRPVRGCTPRGGGGGPADGVPRTITRPWECLARPPRPRSRRRSASSPVRSTRTSSRATRRPSAGSRTSTRPTRSCRTPTSGRQYDALGADWERYSRPAAAAAIRSDPADRSPGSSQARAERRRQRPLRVPDRRRRRLLRLLPDVLRRRRRRHAAGRRAAGPRRRATGPRRPAAGTTFEDVLGEMGFEPPGGGTFGAGAGGPARRRTAGRRAAAARGSVEAAGRARPRGGVPRHEAGSSRSTASGSR